MDIISVTKKCAFCSGVFTVTQEELENVITYEHAVSGRHMTEGEAIDYFEICPTCAVGGSDD